ncbi:MAG: hypothetical protein Q4E17_05680 [Synergistes sp.]|nr:hypothetical protein [Synergistes sp.]
MMRNAVVEIGTNSVKLIMGENIQNTNGNEDVKILFDVNVVTALGEGMKNGVMARASMERTAAAAAKFAEFAKSQGADNVFCCATMALRSAKNTEEFLKTARNLGVPQIRIAAGEEEAALSAAAVLGSVKDACNGRTMIFDTGGGSTEFIQTDGGISRCAVSVPTGAVTLTDEYFRKPPVDSHTVCSVIAALKDRFVNEGRVVHTDRIIGTGGNVTAIAMVSSGSDEYAPLKLHGSVVTEKEVMKQIALYAKCTEEERRRIRGLPPKRAGIILGGACIVLAALQAAEASELTVSTSAMRHEVLKRMFSGKGF